MSRRLSRVVGAFPWVGLPVSFVLAAAWAVSVLCSAGGHVYWNRGIGCTAGITCGTVFVRGWTTPRSEGRTVQFGAFSIRRFPVGEPMLWYPKIKGITKLDPDLELRVPIWIPLGAVLYVTCRSLWRSRRVRTGRCRACGYDKAGLTRDARCPECGDAPDERPAGRYGALTWIGVAACCAACTALGLSAISRTDVTWYGQGGKDNWCFELRSGAILWVRYRPEPIRTEWGTITPTGVRCEFAFGGQRMGWRPQLEWSRKGRLSTVAAPLWIVLALVAVPTVWLLRRDRRIAGQCRKCRYDRRGLAADALCPECGGVGMIGSRYHRDMAEFEPSVDWRASRVIVTGGAGFLGRVVCRLLRERGVAEKNLYVPRRRDFDLTKEADAARLYREAFPGAKVDVVIHLAAEVGGIGANRANPGRYFYANMAMALNLIEQARLDGMVSRGGGGGRFVQVGTICAYPKFTPVPFNEEELWNGYPEETNAPYGVAKKAAWQMLDAYRLQYGMRSAYVLPVNLYGPGDNFDLQSSHVIPALIRKCVEARDRGDQQIVVWGTGAASREFLYVDDAAEGIVRAAECMTVPTPMNLGAGFEITIRDLVRLIVKLTKFHGHVEWDQTRPDGQPRRCLDTGLAERLIGFKAQVGFEEGLKKTIEWWEKEGTKGQRDKGTK